MFHLNRRSQPPFFIRMFIFLLLGFILERIFDQDLDVILQEQVWKPWGMNETRFGPVEFAVPTVRGVEAGIVHDPKARLLGRHAGSAGLFSTVKDLQIFLQHYLEDDFSRDFESKFFLLWMTRNDFFSMGIWKENG